MESSLNLHLYFLVNEIVLFFLGLCRRKMPNTCQPGAHDEFVQHTHVLQGLRQLDQRGVPVPARLLLGDHV